jgi:hypothetical protein
VVLPGAVRADQPGDRVRADFEIHAIDSPQAAESPDELASRQHRRGGHWHNSDMHYPPHRIALAPGLDIPRVVTGLWQVADMERGGAKLDLEPASVALGEYAAEGFDAFDMADHYGSAEEIAGRFLAGAGKGRARVFTKWCPEPGR